MIAPPPSRNDPCPCGSGLRYKHCHGRADAVPAATPAPDGAASESLRTAEASFNLGNLARASGRHDDAVAHFEAALRGAPGHVGVLNNLGLALEAAGRLVAAESIFRRALDAAPDAVEPLANLAQNLYQQRRYAEALPHFDAVFARFPVTQPALWANRSVCLSELGRLDEAEPGLRQALALAPGTASLHRDLGMHCLRMKRYDDAVAVLARGVALDPADLLMQSMLLSAELHTARWDRYDAAARALIDAAGGIASRPGQSLSAFDFAAICDDPALQQQVARSWTRAQTRSAQARATSIARADGPLRLGFLSSDFRNHPVGRLVVTLLESIDRSRFTVVAYEVAMPQRDGLTQRIEAAADVYRSVPCLDPAALAATIRDDAIDILFDLNGLTGVQFAAVFALRPARVQANFIGYTGTLGSPAHDWIVADRYCIDEATRDFYDETLICVDPCYLPSEASRAFAAEPLARGEYGLPAHALVFCAFAPLYKILPPMFAQWMTLLARHPDSVLWLRAAPADVVARLRAEACARGVDGARLVFAPDEPTARHLARLRLADLFLDTHPYGAHTTVNDALYAGLPVVTIAGRSFAGRASASQVAAAGHEDLIARDLAGYFGIADRLASDRAQLDRVRTALRASVQRSALFDSAAYARAFETAVATAWAASAQR